MQLLDYFHGLACLPSLNTEVPPDAAGEGDDAIQFVPDAETVGRLAELPCCPVGAKRDGLAEGPRVARDACGTCENQKQ